VHGLPRLKQLKQPRRSNGLPFNLVQLDRAADSHVPLADEAAGDWPMLPKPLLKR
jgi:hypothetical protein